MCFNADFLEVPACVNVEHVIWSGNFDPSAMLYKDDQTYAVQLALLAVIQMSAKVFLVQ